jgi:uncharacterized protein YgbK (DUF1537 family)
LLSREAAEEELQGEIEVLVAAVASAGRTTFDGQLIVTAPRLFSEAEDAARCALDGKWYTA